MRILNWIIAIVILLLIGSYLIMQALPTHLQEYVIANAVNALVQQKSMLFQEVHKELRKVTRKVYEYVNAVWDDELSAFKECWPVRFTNLGPKWVIQPRGVFSFHKSPVINVRVGVFP